MVIDFVRSCNKPVDPLEKSQVNPENLTSHLYTRTSDIVPWRALLRKIEHLIKCMINWVWL